MINVISKIDYNAIVALQQTFNFFISIDTKDANKVHMPHADNLIVQLNIDNCTLKWVLIDPATDVPLLYVEGLRDMDLHLSMLTPPNSALKSFTRDFSSLLSTIRLPIKIGNEDNKYAISEETFYVINATYIVIIP